MHKPSTEWYSRISVNFSFLNLSRNKIFRYGLGTSEWSLSTANQQTLGHDWSNVSKKKLSGPHFFENRKMTWETYKKLLRYYVFPKHQEYLKTGFLSWMVFLVTPVLCVKIWNKSTTTVRWGELAPFHGFLNHEVSRSLTTFYWNIWMILYTKKLLTQF